MSVREIATKDIQEELSRQGKCFLAFHSELDPVMDKIVENELKRRAI